MIRTSAGARKRPLPNATDNLFAIERAVRGPTSALTDFLANEGIRVRRYGESPTPEPEDAPGQAGQAVQTRARATMNVPAAPAPAQPQPVAPDATVPVTLSTDTPMAVDEEDIDGLVQSTEAIASTSTAAPNKKVKSLSRQKETARKAFEKEQADADYDEMLEKRRLEVEAADQARSIKNVNEISGSTPLVSTPLVPIQPKIGALARCETCSNTFTVTRYSESTLNGGMLCHKCSKVFEVKDAPKAKPKKPTAPARGKALAGFAKEEGKIPALADLCISLLAKHVQDIEAEHGSESALLNTHRRDQLCKIVAKNRRLDSEIAKLFYHVSLTQLELYDATKIDALALGQIATFCPRLKSLKIHFCGLADNDTARAWATLKDLECIDLHGPFLIRAEGWSDFLTARAPQLKSFQIRQSPRFDLKNLQQLVNGVQKEQFHSLQLAQIGQINDSWLPYLHALTNLQSLDLADPASTSLTSEPVTQLLKAIGKHLIALTLDNNYDLMDSVLTEGVKQYCPVLERLSLVNCVELDPAGFIDLFGSGQWACKGLNSLNIEKCFAADDLALAAILSHSQNTLQSLSLHSLRFLTVKALKSIATAKQLLTLDLGFCREADDTVLQTILDGCSRLQQMSLFGCNRVTRNVVQRPGLVLKGVEALTS